MAMRAAWIERTGSPAEIRVGELPVPAVGPRQVLVRVSHVAVNPIDTYVRAGLVPMPLPFPFVVGSDLAGRVEQVGGEVSGFVSGQRVWASCQGLLGRQGSFAEFAAVDADLLYLTPDAVSDEQAAASALVGLTAHLGLVRDAHLGPGQMLLVSGAGGGVGSMVVQIGRALGARVITTVGSEEKGAMCRQLGAEVAICYRDPDLVAKIQAAAPGGVDVWWETAREPNLERAVALLAQRGRIILMAGRDAKVPFPVGPFYVKDALLKGVIVFLADTQDLRRGGEELGRWLASGAIQTPIAQRFPLAETAQAHRLQEENTIGLRGNLSGKIVLHV